MDSETYDKICSSLKCYDDVLRISAETGIPKGVIGCILDQNLVHQSKNAYYRIESRSSALFSLWNDGMTILELADKFKCSPTMAASSVLRSSGYNKKDVFYFFKNPEMIGRTRLREEVRTAVDSDFCFSPRANDLHVLRGQMGEEILESWLSDNNILYLRENDLRKKGFSKTPDFYFEEPITVDGKDVFWIESKALFGSSRDHLHYKSRQYREYAEQFGPGMIIYWFGFSDEILESDPCVSGKYHGNHEKTGNKNERGNESKNKRKNEGRNESKSISKISQDISYLIKDSRFFGNHDGITELLDFAVHWRLTAFCFFSAKYTWSLHHVCFICIMYVFSVSCTFYLHPACLDKRIPFP